MDARPSSSEMEKKGGWCPIVKSKTVLQLASQKHWQLDSFPNDAASFELKPLPSHPTASMTLLTKPETIFLSCVLFPLSKLWLCWEHCSVVTTGLWSLIHDSKWTGLPIPLAMPPTNWIHGAETHRPPVANWVMNGSSAGTGMSEALSGNLNARVNKGSGNNLWFSLLHPN